MADPSAVERDGVGVDLSAVEDDIVDFQSDVGVRKALDEGASLKEYSRLIQEQLHETEEVAIEQFVEHSDNVANLHREIQTCDSILEGLERMLRGFQDSLGGISTDIKKLQFESLSMNIKLKNRRSAERKLSQFINTVMIKPELVKGICHDPIDAKFVDNLSELHAKITYLRHPDAHPSLVETIEHVRTLTEKAVSRIRHFLLQKISELQKSRSNVQVKQAVLLKYKYLNGFLNEHARSTANEVVNFYTNTMATLLGSFFQGYIGEVHSIQSKRANKQLALVDKTDVLCAELPRTAGLFGVGSKKSDHHVLNILSIGDRHKVLVSPPLSPGAMVEPGRPLAWEDVWDSVLHLLVNTALSEYQYVSEFFSNPHLFNSLFVKSIGLVQADLEQYLASCFDIIGILLTVRVSTKHRLALKGRPGTAAIAILDHMFDRFDMLVWPRFKTVFDAHCSSMTAYKPGASDVVRHSAHLITRRFAALSRALVTLNSTPFASDEIVKTSLARLRNTFVSLLQQMAGSLSSHDRIVFLINQLLHVSSELTGAPVSDESLAFDALAEQHIVAYASDLLKSREEFKQIVAFLQSVEASSAGSDSSKQASDAIKTFASQWKQGVHAVSSVICNGQFAGDGAETSWEEPVLKRVSMQLLSYYQRFDEIIRDQYPGLAADLVPIPTLVYQVKKRNHSA